jgi:hypothetical protein
MTAYVPPRYMDFMTEPAPPEPARSPAPEPGFTHRAYVTPLRRQPGDTWSATWEITSTEREEFQGTRAACIAWALARCPSYTALYSRKTGTRELVNP